MCLDTIDASRVNGQAVFADRLGCDRHLSLYHLFIHSIRGLVYLPFTIPLVRVHCRATAIIRIMRGWMDSECCRRCRRPLQSPPSSYRHYSCECNLPFRNSQLTVFPRICSLRMEKSEFNCLPLKRVH